MFIIKYRKNSKSYIRELNPSFLFDLHQGMVTNEHQYVTKMTLNVNMEGLWGDFSTIFWIVKYLHRLIYIWSKVSKCIMSRCGMDFQSIPLHITYNFQHFEPIQHVNGIYRSSPIFQVHNSKVNINLNDFPFPFHKHFQNQ
jgi:hypothetical protein